MDTIFLVMRADGRNPFSAFLLSPFVFAFNRGVRRFHEQCKVESCVSSIKGDLFKIICKVETILLVTFLLAIVA